MGRAARVRILRRALALLTVTAFGALAAGCTTSSPETTGSVAAAAAPRGATVAFESIDGLPQGQFQTLVQDIDREAETRNLAFVSRTAPSQYRIRGYASAQIRGKHTTIAWLWDVYDNTYQRVLRISGEEQSHARGWAGADDRMMAKIAQAGMDQLTPLLLGTVPAAAPAVPAVPSPVPPAAAPEPDSTPMAANPAPMRQAALVSVQ
jgi:hypothetical protein